MVCPQLGAAPRAGRRVRPTAAAGVQLTSTFQGCSVSFMAGEQRLHVAAPKGQGRGPRSVVTCAAKGEWVTCSWLLSHKQAPSADTHLVSTTPQSSRRLSSPFRPARRTRLRLLVRPLARR